MATGTIPVICFVQDRAVLTIGQMHGLFVLLSFMTAGHICGMIKVTMLFFAL